MLEKIVVLKIAKEKVNKTFRACKHDVKIHFDTILKYFYKTGVNL